MPESNEQKVPGAETPTPVTEKVTPSGGGVATPEVVTPTQTPSDAEAKLKEYQDKVALYEQDLNKMKSTFQKKDAAREQEWSRRQQEFEKELEELRVGTMDEGERTKYEAKRNRERMQELQEAVQRLEEEKQEVVAMREAQQYFLEHGVPAKKLVTTEDYQALWDSGMSYIMQQLESTSRQQPVTPQTPITPAIKPPQAPSVDISASAPVTSLTWPELRERYGTDEHVYELIEQKRLSPDILPKPK